MWEVVSVYIEGDIFDFHRPFFMVKVSGNPRMASSLQPPRRRECVPMSSDFKPTREHHRFKVRMASLYLIAVRGTGNHA